MSTSPFSTSYNKRLEGTTQLPHCPEQKFMSLPQDMQDWSVCRKTPTVPSQFMPTCFDLMWIDIDCQKMFRKVVLNRFCDGHVCGRKLLSFWQVIRAH